MTSEENLKCPKCDAKIEIKVKGEGSKTVEREEIEEIIDRRVGMIKEKDMDAKWQRVNELRSIEAQILRKA